MRYWFMSYVWQYRAIDDSVKFGCCVTKGEHPMEKVARWNEEIKDRHTVLLHFHEITDDAAALVQDFDIETR